MPIHMSIIDKVLRYFCRIIIRNGRTYIVENGGDLHASDLFSHAYLRDFDRHSNRSIRWDCDVINFCRSYLDNGTVEVPVPDVSTTSKNVLLGLYIVTLLLAVVGNVCVLGVFLLNKQVRHVTNVFYVSLAVSDLLVAFLSTPFSLLAIYRAKWNKDAQASTCKMIPYVQNVAASATVLTLCCICVERYVAIVHPLRARAIRAWQRLLCLVGGVWLLSVFATIPHAVWHSYIIVPAFLLRQPPGPPPPHCRTPITGSGTVQPPRGYQWKPPALFSFLPEIMPPVDLAELPVTASVFEEEGGFGVCLVLPENRTAYVAYKWAYLALLYAVPTVFMIGAYLRVGSRLWRRRKPRRCCVGVFPQPPRPQQPAVASAAPPTGPSRKLGTISTNPSPTCRDDNQDAHPGSAASSVLSPEKVTPEISLRSSDLTLINSSNSSGGSSDSDKTEPLGCTGGGGSSQAEVTEAELMTPPAPPPPGQRKQQAGAETAEKAAAATAGYKDALRTRLAWRVTLMLVLAMVLFLVAWLPHLLYEAVALTRHLPTTSYNLNVRYYLEWLSVCNSFHNAIVYTFLHERFRRILIEMLTCRRNRFIPGSGRSLVHPERSRVSPSSGHAVHNIASLTHLSGNHNNAIKLPNNVSGSDKNAIKPSSNDQQENGVDNNDWEKSLPLCSTPENPQTPLVRIRISDRSC